MRILCRGNNRTARNPHTRVVRSTRTESCRIPDWSNYLRYCPRLPTHKGGVVRQRTRRIGRTIRPRIIVNCHLDSNPTPITRRVDAVEWTRKKRSFLSTTYVDPEVACNEVRRPRIMKQIPVAGTMSCHTRRDLPNAPLKMRRPTRLK